MIEILMENNDVRNIDVTMKVLILGHAPLPKEHPDYAQIQRHPGRWVEDQAKALALNSELDVTLVTLVKGAKCDFELIDSGVRVVFLRAQSALRYWTGLCYDVYRLRKFINSGSWDILHAHGIEDAYALAIYKMKRPKVLTLQSLYQDYNNTNPVGRLSASRLIEVYEKKALKGFEFAIVKSAQFAEITHKYHSELKIKLIPNTLNLNFLVDEVEKKERCKLIFVGTINERKGFHLIAEAFHLIDSKKNLLELHVYGSGKDTDYAKNQACKIRNAGHKVYFYGCVNGDELKKSMLTANVLLAPSYAETFGNQVIEGILCRCHCIVSDQTGMAENVRKYKSGTIVTQRNSSEIAEAIVNQLEIFHSSSEDQSRSLAKENLIEELGPERVGRELEKVYVSELNKYH